MNEQEKYLFDLQGFLVVPNALAPEQVAALNAILDDRLAQEAAPDANTHRFGSLLDWGQPYLDLIDNPRITPYLEELLGPAFRLDHDYADVIRSGKGPIGTTLHGGATPYDPLYAYRYDNGRLRNGLFVVAYNLKDVHPGEGGFAGVPGSHKSNLPFPSEWRELDTPHPCVQPVVGPAGAAILFTEALTHGTLPWRGKDERRTLFYKYSPKSISWAAAYYNAADYPGLTERQRALLEPPNARYPGREKYRLGR
jgi:ectoine hydroxylase-related dioxygenase (phytanoyl-CoA dioxygenase family)